MNLILSRLTGWIAAFTIGLVVGASLSFSSAHAGQRVIPHQQDAELETPVHPTTDAEAYFNGAHTPAPHDLIGLRYVWCRKQGECGR